MSKPQLQKNMRNYQIENRKTRVVLQFWEDKESFDVAKYSYFYLKSSYAFLFNQHQNDPKMHTRIKLLRCEFSLSVENPCKYSSLVSRSVHYTYCWQQGKRKNLKTVVTRKESRSNFQKNGHFSPPDTYVIVSQGKKCQFLVKCGAFCFLVITI